MHIGKKKGTKKKGNYSKKKYNNDIYNNRNIYVNNNVNKFNDIESKKREL